MLLKKSKKRKSFWQLFFSVILGLACLAVMVFLAASNLKVGQRRSELSAQIKELQEEIQTVEGKNTELKNGINQSQSEEYLEQVARESLDLKKPGEEVVVVKRPATTSGEEASQKERGFWQKIWDRWGF